MIVVARFIPGGRTATTFAAGTLGYPRSRSSSRTTPSRLVLGQLRRARRLLRGKTFEESSWKALVAFGLAFPSCAGRGVRRLGIHPWVTAACAGRIVVNRLAGATSPYLLQHADNPVDWYPWGDEALARARGGQAGPALDRLRGLPLVPRDGARVVRGPRDRRGDERALRQRQGRPRGAPDLDAVYMDAVVALTGGGGWPMTVFLTPDGEPFYGGTYFPPEPRHGMPAFRDVLRGRRRVPRAPRRSTGRRARSSRRSRSLRCGRRRDPLRPRCSTRPAHLRAAFDARLGRLGPRRSSRPRRRSSCSCAGGRARAGCANQTLDGMAAGGMYDLVGGGFHRYSVDERWLVPHFEKMLYDNALLARVYLHAWVVTGEERYREVAEETLDYALRELAPRRRRVRVVAGRGHRRRRGAHVHLDLEGRRAALRGASRAVRGGPVDHPRRLDDEARARLLAIRDGAAAPARRQGDRLVERPRWPRSRRPAGGSTAPTTSAAAVGSPSSCSAR